MQDGPRLTTGGLTHSSDLSREGAAVQPTNSGIRAKAWGVAGLAAGLILGLAVPAVALPPRADLCDGLTGDALTKCLYSDVDDRLRELGSVPTTSPSPSATATATPTPTPTPTTASPTPTPTPTTSAPTGSKAQQILGTPRSGLPWHSGVWLGGRFNNAELDKYATFRGSPMDLTTTYGNRDTVANMTGNTWSITTWNGFQGRLNFGVPLATDDGRMTLATVAAGSNNADYRKLAQNLVNAGRGNSVVRIGWEANYTGWKWGATNANAATFKAAFRNASQQMKAVAPNLVVEFGIGCGMGLGGSSGRLDSLTKLYPGDDVVDLIGCDTYDWWGTATSGTSMANVLKPADSPGVQDVTEFARAHNKGASFGEWGLAGSEGGKGDDPNYIVGMFQFFTANKDVVVFENYFDEPDPYIKNSLNTAGQNPNSAAKYVQLW